MSLSTLFSRDKASLSDLLNKKAELESDAKAVNQRLEAALKTDAEYLEELSSAARGKHKDLCAQIWEAYRIGETLQAGLSIGGRLKISPGSGCYADLIGEDPDQILARETWRKWQKLTREFQELNPAPKGTYWNGTSLIRTLPAGTIRP